MNREKYRLNCKRKNKIDEYDEAEDKRDKREVDRFRLRTVYVTGISSVFMMRPSDSGSEYRPLQCPFPQRILHYIKFICFSYFNHICYPLLVPFLPFITGLLSCPQPVPQVGSLAT